VSVFAAAPTSASAPAAESTRPAAPSADELRARAADALRGSASSMVAALTAKDAALVTSLFGDGIDGDATDLIKTMKDQFGFTASVVQVNQPQMADRSGVIDYRVTVRWVSAAGLTRTRNINLRAEAEQRGDAWAVARHRIVSGWR
jgi:hypothetical protein